VHRARPGDGEIADLIDDQQGRIGQDLQALLETAGRLSLFKTGDQVRQRAVVDTSTMLSRGDSQADGEDASMSVKRP
jgi:hypothetical protein